MGCGASSSEIYSTLNQNNEVPSFKIVIVGEPESGKSSVFLRYVRNQFDYAYKPTQTVTVENLVKKVNVPEHTVVSITMWDVPGREDIDLRSSYYKDVHAAIVVVDMSDEEKIKLAPSWKQSVLNNAMVSINRTVAMVTGGQKTVVDYEKADPSTIPILLMGNKYDLVKPEEKEKEEKPSHQEPAQEPTQETAADSPAPADDETSDKIDAASLKENEDRQSESDGAKLTQVELLEQCATENGFLSSVMVSAKDPGGGVHPAVQSLVRHLLEQKLQVKALHKLEAHQNRQNQAMANRATAKKSQATLTLVGDHELDEVFTTCEGLIKTVEQNEKHLEEVVEGFKAFCRESQAMGQQTGQEVMGQQADQGNPSLEDCITSIKNRLQANKDLQVIEEENGTDDFLSLHLENPSEQDKVVVEAVNHFQKMAAMLAKIRHSCRECEVQLEDSDEQARQESSTIWEKGKKEKKSVEEMKQTLASVDSNRAQIQHSRARAQKCLEQIESYSKKTKAALLW